MTAGVNIVGSMADLNLLGTAFALAQTGQFNTIDDVRHELLRLCYSPEDLAALDRVIVVRSLKAALVRERAENPN